MKTMKYAVKEKQRREEWWRSFLKDIIWAMCSGWGFFGGVCLF